MYLYGKIGSSASSQNHGIAVSSNCHRPAAINSPSSTGPTAQITRCALQLKGWELLIGHLLRQTSSTHYQPFSERVCRASRPLELLRALSQSKYAFPRTIRLKSIIENNPQRPPALLLCSHLDGTPRPTLAIRHRLVLSSSFRLDQNISYLSALCFKPTARRHRG